MKVNQSEGPVMKINQSVGPVMKGAYYESQPIREQRHLRCY